jgi:hypothetical protein
MRRLKDPGRSQMQVLVVVVPLSLLACVWCHESGTMGVAEHGGATLMT